jgi:SH3-like domain-containing protein
MKKALLYVLSLILLLIFNNHVLALCVKVSEANLRKGPGTKYKITWQVYKYMPFKKIAKKGNWYKVQDVDGDIHWIYGKLVTNDFDCAVIKVNEANVRSGPGTKFKRTFLSPAYKYESFKVIKREGSWVKVTDEFGFTGWIFRKLLWIY